MLLTLYIYFQKWYGSALSNHDYVNEHNNPCNLPTLIFISHHKTGGYMKYWNNILIQYCDLKKVELEKIIPHHNDMYCSISSNASLQINQKQITECMTNSGHSKHKKKRNIWKYKQSSTKSELLILRTIGVEYLIVTSKLLDKNPRQSYLPIFMVRNPLYHILSGYNYHAKGQETGWTNKPLNGKRPIHHTNVSLSWCFRNVSIELNM